MKAKLLSKSDPGEELDLTIGERATIGRAKGSTLVLEQKAISTNHAEISFDPEVGAYFLEDLGSLNGTELDGTRVLRRERLGELHAINLGGAVELVFVGVDLSSEVDPTAGSVPEEDGKTSFDKAIPAIPEALMGAAGETEGTRIEKLSVPLPAALGGDATPAPPKETRAAKERPAASQFFLEFDDPEGRKPLAEGDNLVGRLKGADVRISSPDLSRRHAVLTVDGTTVRVRDEGSRNHTFLDGEQLTTEVELSVGSILHFGRVPARLGSLAEVEEEKAAGGHGDDDKGND